MAASSTNENSVDKSAGRPYHDKIAADLRALLAKRVVLDRSLNQIEDRLYSAETEYLESTPNGNMLTGFDNYIKGSSSSAAGGRRKGAINESDRVFSNSSISFKANLDSPAVSNYTTPPHAPTPLSTLFLKESVSNHATPTSATSANKSGAGVKKTKKNGGDDSETDTRETKKVRTNFGATRK